MDVTSDLAAVTELTSVEVSLSRGTTLVTGVDYAFVPADNLDDGVRVAELRAPSDEYVLRVRAFDPAGGLIAEQVRDVRLTSRFGVSVFIDGACVDVTCPGDGDPRTFTACMGGNCVPPACLDDPSLCDVDGGADAGTDAVVDAPLDTLLDVAVDAPLDSDIEPTCSLPGISGMWSIVDVPELRSLDGVDDAVEGADIDGRISDSTDEEGCFISDFVDPDGTSGIDNQLASLVPTIVGLGSEGLGPTLMMAGVSFSVRTGTIAGGMCDIVIFSAEGEEYQAPGFVRDNIMRATFAGSRMTMPWLTEEGLTMRDLSVRFDTRTDVVHLSGRLSVEELVDSFVVAGGGMVPEDTVRSLLESLADLDPDPMGVCRSLSASFEAR